MLFLDVTLEDVRMHATWDENEWIIQLFDSVTGKNDIVRWSQNELATVLALSIDNEHPREEEMYEIVKPLFEKLPKELRMVP